MLLEYESCFAKKSDDSGAIVASIAEDALLPLVFAISQVQVQVRQRYFAGRNPDVLIHTLAKM